MDNHADANDTPTRVPDALVPRVRHLVHQLVVGEYGDLIQRGVAEGWTPDNLATYIKEMEHDDDAPLTDLPDAFFEVDDSTLALGDDRYSVLVRLWTTKGPSNYSLVIDFEPSPDGHTAHFENLEIM